MIWFALFLIGFSFWMLYIASDDVGAFASLLVFGIAAALFVMAAEQGKSENRPSEETESVWPKHKDTVSIDAKRIE